MSRLGPYELIDRLALGGVAEIFRARDTRNGDIVVIKRLRSDRPYAAQIHAGFLREMQVSLQAKHKNLILGFELGTHNGNVYGVMEYVDGQDLETVLQRARNKKIKVPYAFATFIISEILDGLDFAHNILDQRQEPLGLVHRDLAPKNIFVRYDGSIRVGDFGLSLATRQEVVADVLGTAGYLSPEQARGDPLDARSDLFSVGCILYEIVMGQRAFDVTGKRDSVMLRTHGQGKHRPLTRKVPAQLAMLIETALSLHRDDRFKTAGDMRRALRDTEHPPDDAHSPLGIATMLRSLFAAEFKSTRLAGNPLPFMSGL